MILRFALLHRSTISTTALLSILTLAKGALAQTEGLGIASQLPPEVLEVVAGGTWSEGSATGMFRTVTVQSEARTDIAEVYLQWVGTRTATSSTQIISSVPLREFNQKKLGSASVNLETETDGEAHIVIAAQDSEGHPSMVTFIARMPGRYEMLGEPAEPSAVKRP